MLQAYTGMSAVCSGNTRNTKIESMFKLHIRMLTAGENSQQELRFTGFIDHNEAA